MSRQRNPFIPIAEAALAAVLELEQPATARNMHNVLGGSVEFLSALNRAFELEPAMTALRVRAVDYVLDQYGEALDTGRDAVHVPQHTPETMARRVALLEQQRAQLTRSLERVRAEYAQLTLDGDLERIAST